MDWIEERLDALVANEAGTQPWRRKLREGLIGFLDQFGRELSQLIQECKCSFEEILEDDFDLSKDKKSIYCWITKGLFSKLKSERAEIHSSGA